MAGTRSRNPVPETLLVVAANLVPVAGVLAWNWHGADIVILYWAEMLIGGACFVLTVLVAPSPATVRDRLTVAAVLSGMFVVIALVTLAAVGGLLGDRHAGAVRTVGALLTDSVPRVRLGLAAFALRHVASMLLGLGGDDIALARALYNWFTAFGQRVPVIFGAVMISSFVTMLWPSGPAWLIAAAALILLKTVVEVRTAQQEPTPVPKPADGAPSGEMR